VLSAALLLAWHGRRKPAPAFEIAAQAIEHGVAAAIVAGETTRDIGGALGTREAGSALAKRLRAQ
jgi:3-isopropylmalate dehydrogenase